MAALHGLFQTSIDDPDGVHTILGRGLHRNAKARQYKFRPLTPENSTSASRSEFSSDISPYTGNVADSFVTRNVVLTGAV